MTDTAQYRDALDLTDCGLSVIPIRPDKTKRPMLESWSQYQKERATPSDLRKWFSGGAGVAVVNGAVSGNLETLDFDESGLLGEFLDLCTELGLGDIVGACPLVGTPSGGCHLYYRCEQAVGGNTKLAMKPVEAPEGTPGARPVYGRWVKPVVRIETRGEGGYALIPPTPAHCHEDGKPYVYLTGIRLTAVPAVSAETRQTLLDLARSFNQWFEPERVVADPRPRLPSDGLRPGDDYNSRGEWPDLLERNGWTRKEPRGGKTLWARPGKTHGISATENYADSGLLYVFSGNAYPLEEDRAYSLFSAYALLEHGGDFAAAARELGKLGFGDPPKRPTPAAAPGKDLSEKDLSEKEAKPSPDLDGGKAGPSELQLATAWASEAVERFLYVEGDQWWRYEGGCWQYSNLESVQADVQRYLTLLRGTNDKISVTRSRIQGVVFLAKSLLGPVPLTEFDARPDWIPLRNGVFDICSGQLLPHSPQNRLTHQSPFDYDEAAKCPRWERFLCEVMLTAAHEPNPEWIDLLQEWFGYCLIPDVSAQSAMFWVGEGGNGKGVATRVLENLVGPEYSTAIPIEQLHDPYYRADLYGKLVGLVNEPDPRAMQKNGTFFKMLTGGDRIDARRPTEKVFKFRPTCRIVVSCNDLPTTRDVSRGYFRRIILIEWRYNVPDAQKDRGLDDRLAREMPGIFNWAIDGLKRWQRRGHRFDASEESSRLLTDYRMSEDTLARFLSEETVPDATGFVGSSAFYSRYSHWCRNNGEHAVSAASAGRQMVKHGYQSQVRRVGQATFRGWQGLTTTAHDPEDA